jgi:hypothetical protein
LDLACIHFRIGIYYILVVNCLTAWKQYLRLQHKSAASFLKLLFFRILFDGATRHKTCLRVSVTFLEAFMFSDRNDWKILEQWPDCPPLLEELPDGLIEDEI